MAVDPSTLDEANNLLRQGALKGDANSIKVAMKRGANKFDDDEEYNREVRYLFVLFRRIRDRPLDEEGILAIAPSVPTFIDTAAEYASCVGVPPPIVKKLLCIAPHRQFRMRWSADRGPLIDGVRTAQPHVTNPLQSLVARLPRPVVAEIILQLATEPSFY